MDERGERRTPDTTEDRRKRELQLAGQRLPELEVNGADPEHRCDERLELG